jgi:exodeoxyribonuclease V gamma subunit
VPLAELLDVVDRTVRTETGSPQDQILIRHPLQPFDPRNFVEGALSAGSPWSFDPVALDGARALAGPRASRPPFLEQPLPPLESEIVELDQLVRFVEHPARSFLRGRLGINVRESLDEVRDGLPVELDNLEEWGVGRRLLEGLLAGATIEDCVRAEEARGTLPPAMLAATVLARVRPVAERIADEALRHGEEPAVSLDVNLRLAEGRILAGTVAGVHGHTLRRVSYSRVRPKDRIAAWVRLLALTAARPEEPWESVVIGRVRAKAYGAETTLARIPPLGSDRAARERTALEQLSLVVDLYDSGMRELLPIACQASAAYARAAFDGEDEDTTIGAARDAWESGFRFDKEDREPEHMLAHGGQLPLAELLGDPPREDEAGIGWAPEEQSRFGRYARRLWEGVLVREELSDR